MLKNKKIRLYEDLEMFSKLKYSFNNHSKNIASDLNNKNNDKSLWTELEKDFIGDNGIVTDIEDDEDSNISLNQVTWEYRPPSDSNIALTTMIPPDLLVYCFTFLSNISDIISLFQVCKLFNFVLDRDIIWFPLRVKFISALKKDDIINYIKGGPSYNSNQNKIQNQVTNTIRICNTCSLTQALSTSTNCEMCQTPLSNNTRDTSLNTSPFIIIKSTEDLAYHWVESRKTVDKNIKNYEKSFTHKNNNNNNNNYDNNNNYYPIIEAVDNTSSMSRNCSAQKLNHSIINNIIGKKSNNWKFQVGLSEEIPIIENHYYIEGDCSFGVSNNWYMRCKLGAYERQSEIIWEAMSKGWEWSKSNEVLIRALRKLTSYNWVQCYESIKSEFNLQADALARDLKQDFCKLPSSEINDDIIDKNDAIHFLRKLIELCSLFLSWAEELEDNSLSLSEKISNEHQTRQKPMQELNYHSTPHITQMALLALRNHCFSKHWIKRMVSNSFLSLCAEYETPDDDYNDNNRYESSYYSSIDTKRIFGTQDSCFTGMQSTDRNTQTYFTSNMTVAQPITQVGKS
eukprot:gene11648-15600_t